MERTCKNYIEVFKIKDFRQFQINILWNYLISFINVYRKILLIDQVLLNYFNILQLINLVGIHKIQFLKIKINNFWKRSNFQTIWNLFRINYLNRNIKIKIEGRVSIITALKILFPKENTLKIILVWGHPLLKVPSITKILQIVSYLQVLEMPAKKYNS